VTDSDDRIAALEERRRLAARDLEELTEQVEAGEIDEATAARLEEGYRAELADAEARLAKLGRSARPGSDRPAGSRREQPAPKSTPSAGAGARRPSTSPRNILIGMIGVLVALTVVIVIAGRGGDEEGAAAAPPTSAGPEIGSTGDPLADMEAAVAAHPESNEMRLALAGMYFDVGQYLPAMEHYMAVLDNEPTPDEESVALARVGWMAYVTDQPNAAVDYLNAALAIDPAYGEAKLFLGVVLLYGLEDHEAAIPVLEEVLEFPDLPEQLRPDVENMLAEALARRDEG
jgi:tetratricopeptide (TPR) repeat protein